MKSETSIWITTYFEGFHSWKEAPEEVEYLRNKHRHLFYVKVELPILSRRENEFHLLLQFVRNRIGTFDLQNLPSCEEIAETLSRLLISHYNLQWVKVTISEDRENGATVCLQK